MVWTRFEDWSEGQQVLSYTVSDLLGVGESRAEAIQRVPQREC